MQSRNKAGDVDKSLKQVGHDEIFTFNRSL
jgi:hypothetical protein